jgi:hypothetical protein
LKYLPTAHDNNVSLDVAERIILGLVVMPLGFLLLNVVVVNDEAP